MEMTKTAARQLLKRCYYPGGEEVRLKELKFRKTLEHEVFRCCVRTGSDSQSGPDFCGEIAEFIADVVRDGEVIGIVALCGNSRSHLPQDIRPADCFSLSTRVHYIPAGIAPKS